MKESYLSPSRYKLVLVKSGGHVFLTIFSRFGKYVGILDFDVTNEELAEWAHLHSLGYLTLADLV